jgi:hypothetical protein
MKFDPCNCTPKAMVALATTIAFALSEGLSSEEVSTLGNFFSIIGTDLQYIGSHLELCCPTNQRGGKKEKPSQDKQPKTSSSNTHESSFRSRFMDIINDISDE